MSDEFRPPSGDGLGYRTPPNDLLAEQWVLGSVMLSRGVVDDVLGSVAGRDFYQPKHETLFEVVVALVGRGDPCDVPAVVAELQVQGLLSRVPAEYVHSLTSIPTTTANADYYADRVADLAIRRRLVEAGVRTTQMGYASEGATQDLVNNARAEIDEVVGLRASAVVMMSATVHDTILSLGSPVVQAPSPWWQLNNFIGGFRPGGLYVIGARPGVGKSNTGLQIASGLARRGAVAFCSLEMSERELQLRLIAQGAGVPLAALDGSLALSDGMRGRVQEWRVSAPLDISFETSGGMSVFDVRAFARSVHRVKPLSGVVVDYVQLMTDGRDVSRQEKVADMTRGLKLLAKEMQVPVIALSQLNRDSEKRADKVPALADMRESGAVEQDADVVVLLHRDMEATNDASDGLLMIVAKNRHGQTGLARARWQGEFVRAVDPYRPPGDDR